MTPGHWLRLVLCVPFSALTPMVGWKEGHPTCKKPVPPILRGSLLEQVEEEDPGWNWLNQIHIEKWPLNRISSCVLLLTVQLLLVGNLLARKRLIN